MSPVLERQKRTEFIVDISYAFLKSMGLTGGKAKGTLLFHQQDHVDGDALQSDLGVLKWKELITNKVDHPWINTGLGRKRMHKVLRELGLVERAPRTLEYCSDRFPNMIVEFSIYKTSYSIVGSWYPGGLP